MYALGGTTIRAVELDDLPATRRWRNDPNVSGTALGRRFPITAINETAWFERLGQGEFPTQLVWAVADQSDAVVGVVELNEIDWIHRTSSFGIWIGAEHWGNGHASSATRMACRHGFRVLALRQIRLRVLADHDTARAVYLKNGFVDEGIMRAAVLIDGCPHDVRVMLLSTDTDNEKTVPTG